MNRVLCAALAAALLVPAAGFAAEATGKIKAWDANKKMVTLVFGDPQTEVACTLAPNIRAPLTTAVDRNAEITYNSRGGANTCMSMRLK